MERFYKNNNLWVVALKQAKTIKDNLKTVRKWETELDCPLEYDIGGNDVIRLHCKTC